MMTMFFSLKVLDWKRSSMLLIDTTGFVIKAINCSSQTRELDDEKK